MSRTQPPLAGTRILELGVGLALPFGARILADLGADVVKVETPDGDRTRAVEPNYLTDDGEYRSALFEYLNWNKQSVVLDPAADQSTVAALVAQADIVMVGDDVALWAQWGLDPNALRVEHPALVLVSLTPFGTTGPKRDWAANDLILQAASGLMSFSGTADRPPLKRGLRQSTYETGLNAAYTALAGFFAARRGDGGVFVDISQAEVISSEIVLQTPEYTYAGAVAARRPGVLDPFGGDPVKIGGGYVTVQTSTMMTPADFAKFLDAPALADQRFQSSEGRASNANEVVRALRDALVGVDPRDFFERSAQAGLLTGVSQTAAQLLDSAQLTERNVWIDMPGTLGGKLWRMPFLTASFSATGAKYRRPAPALGEDNQAVLTEGAMR